MAADKPKNGPNTLSLEDDILSPGFRSVAAMAGWDEEALLSSLVSDNTPPPSSRRKNRRRRTFKSPPSTKTKASMVKRRDKVPRIVLRLDDSEDDDDEVVVAEKADVGEKGKGIECLDRLREELSCAICLEICFEPSTTSCGHSFCKKCLNRAAAKCGRRCPKCRQSISYGRDCTVNTVLWNTIQLLFPSEVEERKKAMATASPVTTEARNQSPVSSRNLARDNARSLTRVLRPAEHYRVRSAGGSSQSEDSTRNLARDNARSSTRVLRPAEHYRVRRAGGPSQSEDAALALRLQREEFLGSFHDTYGQQRDTLRARLRATGARADDIRRRY